MSKFSLSVIIPVFNEEQTIEQVLRKLIKVKDVTEIILVDDGSTDNTLKNAKKVKDERIRVYPKSNGGKGSAVRLGLTKVTSEYVLIQDADLEYDPEDIEILLDPIKKERVQVVYGSRFLGSHSNLLFWHWVGNWFLNLLVNVLYNTTLSDMETCYKIMPTQVMRELELKSSGFDLEPEITCKLLRRKINIFEVPITYVGRNFSEGKKITWKDGIQALKVIVGLRLFP